jgi:hypothetical protein
MTFKKIALKTITHIVKGFVSHKIYWNKATVLLQAELPFHIHHITVKRQTFEIEDLSF